MADQTPQVATPAAATGDPRITLAAQTKALAKEIAAETASGADWSDSDSAPAPRETLAAVKAGTAAAPVVDDGDDDGEVVGGADEPAGGTPDAATGIDPELAALVESRDLDALAARLGIADAAEYFGIKPEDFKAIRHERKKIDRGRAELDDLSTKLRDKYGDPIVARKAWEAGDLNTYFQTLERWSGVPHADVQKAWTLHVQGKPVPKLEPKPVVAQAVTVDAGKVAALKTRIGEDIKADPLASTPGIVDLVFEKMRAGWNKGVRTPVAALKLVAADLVERNKAERAALKKAGLIKSKPAAPVVQARAVTPRAGTARTQATEGKPGSTRPMTDRELAADVMKSLGKEAWR